MTWLRVASCSWKAACGQRCDSGVPLWMCLWKAPTKSLPCSRRQTTTRPGLSKAAEVAALHGAAAVGVCLEQELDEAESDASTERHALNAAALHSAAVQAGVVWQHYGEQSTFWFYHLARERQAQTTITQLHTSTEPLQTVTLDSFESTQQAAHDRLIDCLLADMDCLD
ncbi:g5903 [Coccomyxa viridis]|uniref:G5903 protein n=1 Tax=Coccomyxa viridis TaxID=1274662 RepID=A0ABP1FY05_9CHLO